MVQFPDGCRHLPFFCQFISAYFHTYVDLTQDKRYTLTEATVETFEK